MAAQLSFVNDFVSFHTSQLRDTVEDEESLTQLSTLLRDSLVKFMETHKAPARLRAPRAPRAPRVQNTTETTTETTTESATVQTETTEGRKRKPKVPKTEGKLPKMNGYNLFIQNVMRTHPVISVKQTKNEAGETTGLSSTEKMKESGSLWKQLSEAEHTEWKNRAAGYNFFMNSSMTGSSATNEDGSARSFKDRVHACEEAWVALSISEQATWVAQGMAEQSARQAAKEASRQQTPATQTA